MSAAAGGILGGLPLAPYASPNGMYISHLSPCTMSCIASVQPEITWLGANVLGVPRLYELSNSVPSSSRPARVREAAALFEHAELQTGRERRHPTLGLVSREEDLAGLLAVRVHAEIGVGSSASSRSWSSRSAAARLASARPRRAFLAVKGVNNERNLKP
eukprot:scaffold38839_cov64-Phaeocystis_antarctica.AAC.5